MAECRGELSLNASVAINAKGGDCWQIQLTDRSLKCFGNRVEPEWPNAEEILNG
jgi:hypothetical protein